MKWGSGWLGSTAVILTSLGRGTEGLKVQVGDGTEMWTKGDTANKTPGSEFCKFVVLSLY